MPLTIQPSGMKYKNGNTFQSADCLKGDTGDSGVYYGSTEPTDPNVKVWIDPTGECFDPSVMDNKKADVIIPSVTGNPVTFSDGSDGEPLQQCKVNFFPIQNGSGDPSPTNVRPITGWTGMNATCCGKNLLDYSKIVDADVMSGDRKAVLFTKPGTYYVKALKTWDEAYIYAKVKDVDGTLGDTLYVVGNTLVTNKTVTITEGQTLIVYNASAGVNGTVEKTIERFDGWGIIVSFDDMTVYAPYSGTTCSVTFPALGKNLIKGTEYAGQFFNISSDVNLKNTTTHASYTESGNAITVTTDGSWWGCIFATDVLAPGTYNVHSETSDDNCRRSIYVTDANLITKTRYSVTSNNVAVVLEENERIAFTINNQSTGSITLTNLQVESGSSYTSWESYTNTVYGGSLDLVTGLLTAEWGYMLLNDADSWIDSGGTYFSYTGHDVSTRQTGDSYNIVCSAFPASQESSGTAYIRWGGTTAYNILIAPNSSSLTISDVKTMATNGNIAVAYPLATPITYQLTPQQINTLLGNNTIWSDVNGNVDVKYRADTALYLNKYVTDVQVNNISVVQNGVANVPIAGTSNLGVVKYSSIYGVTVGSNGLLYSVPAVDDDIKRNYDTAGGGEQTGMAYKCITPRRQHQSVFYGLAKAAGDSTQSSSENNVGTYTENAKIAIQKMLGIYQAPWELIREDSVTNNTEDNIIITVDSNGESFELTDIRMMINLPTQENAASIHNYGRVKCYYDANLCDTLYIGSWDQAAGANSQGGKIWIEQKDGMITRGYVQKGSSGSSVALQTNNAFEEGQTSIWQLGHKTYTKIVIESVTGTCNYHLFGKRKVV